jgi:hypothetical protein
MLPKFMRKEISLNIQQLISTMESLNTNKTSGGSYIIFDKSLKCILNSQMQNTSNLLCEIRQKTRRN